MTSAGATSLNAPPTTRARSDTPWLIASVALVVIIAAGLRLGTNILSKSFVFDEQYITGPINDIIEHGWSVRTAIDFKETKGPGLIWPYAVVGQIIGGDLNSLRLISASFFALAVLPLLILARWCGIGGPRILLVALLYALLPYHAVLGQLVMSEPSFALGSALLMLTFIWSFGDGPQSGRRIAGSIIFAVILSILLHNRIHAAAFAGAACLVAFERDRWRSWPWWLAGALAGLSRLPLWIRWGGLVHPDYAQMHDLGFRLDSLAYIAAAMTPLTVLFLWLGLFGHTHRRSRFLVGAGATIGALLVIAAPPALSQILAVKFDDTSFEAPLFQGIAATFARTVSASSTFQSIILGILAALGLGSVGALAALAWKRTVNESSGIVLRLLVWTLLCGWAMYALTSGYVFDRYLLGWAILLPIAWVLLLPRTALALQIIVLVIVLARHVQQYLM